MKSYIDQYMYFWDNNMKGNTRVMSHMSAVFNFDFSISISGPFKKLQLIFTWSKSDIWLQKYEQFFDVPKQSKT